MNFRHPIVPSLVRAPAAPAPAITSPASTGIMRRLIVAIAVVAISATPLIAQEPVPAGRVEAAREMLEASLARENFVRSMALGLEQGGVEFTPAVRATLREFMDEHFSYAQMEPELIRIYTGLFTEDELRGFTAFYRTPVGRRMAELNPELVTEINLVTNTRLQELMPELTRRIMEAMQAEGGQP